MLEKKHNRLESDSGDGIALWGNPEMLLQVLINLTVNANRHTENGMIAYRITDEGERVCLRVSDTGSGIAPDLLPHIFEKGCSGDGGSGIGLTICADAMKIHHGYARGGAYRCRRHGVPARTAKKAAQNTRRERLWKIN